MSSPIYVDTLGFIGGKMGPPEFTPEICDRIKKSGVRIVQWGGPHPYPKNGFTDLISEVKSAASEIEARPEIFRLVRTRQDLADLETTSLTHVVLGVQNPACVGEKWEHLDELYEAGVRVMQLSYWDERDAVFGYGFLSSKDHGLTVLGRQYLKELALRGFILDLSHLAPRTAIEAATEFEGWIMISHTGSRAIYPYPRGADDALFFRVASSEGVIGVYSMTFFLDALDNGLSPWLRHICHIVNVVGTDHVCVGTDAPVAGFPDVEAAKVDFPMLTVTLSRGKGLEGNLAPRWPAFLPAFDNTNRFAVMYEALYNLVGEMIARKIVGENALRFYRRALAL